MSRPWPLLLPTALTGLLLLTPAAPAGPFGNGIGGAMYYGPYTGGHGYSYNTAYSYGLAFNTADTWRRDPLAYPAGVQPYRPPVPAIRYFQRNPTFIAVPGGTVAAPVTVLEPVSGAETILSPVPVAAGGALVKVRVPDGAEVWFEGNKTAQTGTERSFQSPPLQVGQRYAYTVRARWSEAGREREQIQIVDVQAGGTSSIVFPRDR